LFARYVLRFAFVQVMTLQDQSVSLVTSLQNKLNVNGCQVWFWRSGQVGKILQEGFVPKTTAMHVQGDRVNPIDNNIGIPQLTTFFPPPCPRSLGGLKSTIPRETALNKKSRGSVIAVLVSTSEFFRGHISPC